MCDCKKVIEGKLKTRFVEQQPEAKEHGARLTGYALIFGETLTEKGAMEAELKANFPLKKGGEKQKTIRHSMIFTFCPFCGIKYESA
jgi:hypothetical protein